MVHNPMMVVAYSAYSYAGVLLARMHGYYARSLLSTD
jgi:hypothetical protein